MMKRCTHCGTLKHPHDFHRDRAQSDGRCKWCRPCGTIKKRNYRIKVRLNARR